MKRYRSSQAVISANDTLVVCLRMTSGRAATPDSERFLLGRSREEAELAESGADAGQMEEHLPEHARLQ